MRLSHPLNPPRYLSELPWKAAQLLESSAAVVALRTGRIELSIRFAAMGRCWMVMGKPVSICASPRSCRGAGAGAGAADAGAGAGAALPSALRGGLLGRGPQAL